jgi:glucose/arabinose dehydrogenase
MNLRITAAALTTLCAMAPAIAQDVRQVQTSSGMVQVETFASGLNHPWGMAMLPDGGMLVTERPGRLRVVTKEGKLLGAVKGTPRVFASGQGGLLDVALAPSFAQDRLVYLTFAEAGSSGTAGTALARGRLSQDMSALEDVRVIFRQEPKVSGGQHFGSRIAFGRDGAIFMTMGDRGKFDPAQDLSVHIGKVIRIRPDGSAPQDNPFIGKPNVRPEIWSYGHRNAQGAAMHPETGVLWTHEMGPRNGDEVNVTEAGKNYGWPRVSWGNHYDGRDIPDPPTQPALTDAAHHWKKSIAPSGMAFYTGELFSGWRNSVLIGGLVAQAIVRVSFDGVKFTGEERIPLGARIRDVGVGPDGAVYAATDEENGRVLRLKPGG